MHAPSLAVRSEPRQRWFLLGLCVFFLAINVVFFFVYLGIPVAAHLLVSGAGRPFRGAVR